MTLLTFETLASYIRNLHENITLQTRHAINANLTIRNWLIGWHIAEYQLKGADRAKYGERLFEMLAENLEGVSNCNQRELRNYLHFYKTYQKLLMCLNETPLNSNGSIFGTISLQSEKDGNACSDTNANQITKKHSPSIEIAQEQIQFPTIWGTLYPQIGK